MQRARLMAVLLVVGATIAAAVWWMRRDEVVELMNAPAPVSEEERQIRGAVLHNVSGETVQEVLRIEAQEKQVAETVWAKEMLAQECGRVFERLWDEVKGTTNAVEGGEELRRGHIGGSTESTEEGRKEEGFGSEGKLGVLARFGVGEVRFGKWEEAAEKLPHGIRVWSSVSTRAVGQQAQPLTPTLSPSEGAREERSDEPLLLTKAKETDKAPRRTEAKAVAEGALAEGEWKAWVERKIREGWVLEQIEFRQNRFEVDGEGAPARSVFYFAANLLHAVETNRVSVEGDLVVHWGARRAEDGSHSIGKVDASGLTLKMRRGEPLFKLVLKEEVVPLGQSKLIDPVILHDLDGDGFLEIILAGRNLQLKRGNYAEAEEGAESAEEKAGRIVGGSRQGSPDVAQSSAGNSSGRASPTAKWEFQKRELCRYPEEFIKTALVADFNGDGVADLLAKKWEGLFLFNGGTNGLFETKPQVVWKAKEPLMLPMVMTCGDIDADGDLDLFIGQYKEPYEGGATPRPFYDANDGEPAYVLVNDGTGGFRDGTQEAGLTGKRNRRAYSASFADLDRDSDLDLLVVSDFAGLDLYRNDGKGRFTEVTREWVQPETATKAFGMAHALSDFNRDGLIDVLMMGMTSATVERIDHLGLSRNESEVERTMRRAMTHGNRLLLGKESGGFEETKLSESIARSGWSWGCSSLDFDNDGWVDVYVGNGLESKELVHDYEPEYWLHDRFVGATDRSAATDLYFASKFSRTRGRTDSYGGYEKNRFYLNRGGESFVEVGHLLGVALEQDCRNVVSGDLDNDGDMDLIVTTWEIWPTSKQALYVFENQTQERGNWIGFQFQGSAKKSPIGASVTVETEAGTQVQHLVTGDSYRSQRSNRLHFGLGASSPVKVEVRWAKGERKILERPAVNRYHTFE